MCIYKDATLDNIVQGKLNMRTNIQTYEKQPLVTFRLICFYKIVIVEKTHVPKHLEDRLVLLHPSLMHLCGFMIGGFCVVNNTKLLTSWPSAHIGATSAGLSHKNLKSMGICLTVSVQAFSAQCGSLRVAERIQLKSEYDFIPVFLIVYL